MSDSLWCYKLQHTRPPYPSLSPGACSNSCPLSRWCHPTISSSVTPFSSCLQPFPASASFLKSQLFASGGQHSGVSASASVLPMNIQGWLPLGLKCLNTKETYSLAFQMPLEVSTRCQQDRSPSKGSEEPSFPAPPTSGGSWPSSEAWACRPITPGLAPSPGRFLLL